MNYKNYETAIIERYHVRLRGWPLLVLFANPSDIGILDKLLLLRDSLRTGNCLWVRLSKKDQDEHQAKLKEFQEEGGVVGKPRKQRSDKGTKRKRQTTEDDEDDVENGQVEAESEAEGRSQEAEGGKKKRKKRKTASGEKGGRPKKMTKESAAVSRAPRASTSKLPPLPKSHEFIDSDSDEENE